jgi:hypothetical protein
MNEMNQAYAAKETTFSEAEADGRTLNQACPLARVITFT